MSNIRECSKHSNKVIILCDKTFKVTELDKDDVKNINSYVEYSNKRYDGTIAYTKYIINEQIIDNNNNIILLCNEEYYPFE